MLEGKAALRRSPRPEVSCTGGCHRDNIATAHMVRFTTQRMITLGWLAVGLPAQADELQERIQVALRAARPALMAHIGQHQQLAGGPLALVCLAALHDRVAPDDPVLAAALARLARANLSQTYPLSLRLMVAEACPALPDRDAVVAADYERLLRHCHDGAFSYTSSNRDWDLSNTQYAALGLRAAASMGIEVPRRVWTRLADEVMDAQRRDGGFSYRSRRDAAYPSMTVAGIAVLAICRQALARPGRTIPALDARIARSWRWMAANGGAIGDADERWSFYFHYGLERAAILCDVTEVGEIDWYRRGAGMFGEQQRPAGGWQTAFGNAAPASPRHGSPIDTAFAVLFLRRSFRKIAGPVTGPRTIVLAMLDSDSTGSQVHQCAKGLVVRGKLAMVDILKAMRSEVPPRRRAAAMALALIAGSDFGFDPKLAAEHNREALRKAELWYLKNR